MLLEQNTALLYGAAGHVGAAVAHAFAAEGAHVVLTGRTPAALDALASQINAQGGRAETAQLDATDASSVEKHFASVVDRAGAVDVSFNLIGLQEVQGQELVAMTLEDYLRPSELAARSHFITATTAARHMTTRRRGVGAGGLGPQMSPSPAPGVPSTRPSSRRVAQQAVPRHRAAGPGDRQTFPRGQANRARRKVVLAPRDVVASQRAVCASTGHTRA